MRAGAVLGLAPLSCVAVLCGAVLSAATTRTADWVPMRWPWTDVKSLELLSGTAINCLLLKAYPETLVAAAAGRGMVTLAVLTPGGDAVAAARRALDAKVNGIVLEGEFPESAAAGVREAAGAAPGSPPVIALTARDRMAPGSGAPVIGTYQGEWPGIVIADKGSKKAGPTAASWIETNTEFLQTMRARGAGADTAVWIGIHPPARSAISGSRYLQVIADAGISGARWVLTLDADFAGRLAKRDPAALNDWKRIVGLVGYFERHPEWRGMRQTEKQDVVRLFNASTILFNYLASEDGKSAVVHLVNYSDYPVENVTMHYPGNYKHATLITPQSAEKTLEVYESDGGWGVDLEKVSVCATVRLEQ
jgi:hypothetical protein